MNKKYFRAAVCALAFVCAAFFNGPFPPAVFGQKSAADDSRTRNRRAPKSNLIVAGVGAGGLRLGDSREKAIAYFGRLESEYDYNLDTKLKCPARKELRFWDAKDESNPFFEAYGDGAWVYLVNDGVEQIKIQSGKFRTPEGLTIGAAPARVRRAYPNIRTFVELNSRCECTGGRNLIFWVDRSRGIAFEFQYRRDEKARLLSNVFVFKPGAEFLPEGCVYLETQGWREIAPFSLEEPAGMQAEWERENKVN
ncbi:MAG TPA: hypothetical protein VIL74_21200 [Pyrinomonadaceae bacterium]|jgi:hypothetical protein